MAQQTRGWVKIVPVLILVVAGVWGGLYAWDRWAPKKAPVVSSVAPKTRDLPTTQDLDDQSVRTAVGSSTPLAAASASGEKEIRAVGLAWNAQIGWHRANGGVRTTKDSPMYKHGVRNLVFSRMDAFDKQQAMIISCVEQLSKGAQDCTNGVHFMSFMGDAGAVVLTGLSEALVKYGPDYQPEIIGSAGKSYGEDKCMGPPSWRANPQLARGGIIIGVKKDGDLNTCIKYFNDNDVPIQPDTNFYDPDAVNFVDTDDNNDAAVKYITGAKFTLKVIKTQRDKEGKPTKAVITGEVVARSADGTAVWTPADVKAVEERGGVVTLADTQMYPNQMPHIIVGIKKWNRNNAPLVIGMLAAMCEGGDLIKRSEAELIRASVISHEIYKEDNTSPKYWATYFKGRPVEVRIGEDTYVVRLGGSRVHNCADNLHLFGMQGKLRQFGIQRGGETNLYAASYTFFGDRMVHYYKDFPKYEPLAKFLNTSYIAAAAEKIMAKEGKLVPQDLAKFTPGAVKDVVSKKSWTIGFETDKATLTPQALRVMREMHAQLSIAENLKVMIDGHTDSTGSRERNRPLSVERADAAKAWLEDRDPSMHKDRITTRGFGQDQPVADNSTSEGRARNRRVVIILGN